MSDLEMTKLCAEAMGIEYSLVTRGSLSPQPYQVVKIGEEDDGIFRREIIYNPLHDDAQAMALVKKLALHVGHQTIMLGDDPTQYKNWFVTADSGIQANGPDLNRAVCECVAKM